MARTQSVKLNKSKIDQNPQEVLHKEHAETKESLWAARGMDDVFFQREAQVTWWSVMVGIAVGALLTRLEALLLEIQNGHWYFALYFLAICCIIINSWVQTAWGSLVLRCPISIPFASSLFFQGLFMSVAALSITNPYLWYAAITFVVAAALFNQILFSRTRWWITLPEENVERARIGIRIYIGLVIFTIASSVFLAFQTAEIFAIIWGILALLFSILSLIWQHLGMTEEKSRLGIA